VRIVDGNPIERSTSGALSANSVVRLAELSARKFQNVLVIMDARIAPISPMLTTSRAVSGRRESGSEFPPLDGVDGNAQRFHLGLGWG